MRLQLGQRFPDELALAMGSSASVWELAEVDAVADNLVHLLQEVAARLTIGAASIVVRTHLLWLSSSAAISTGRHHIISDFRAHVAEGSWRVGYLFVV